jgi:glycosyltransferase involved in cell wall biosynthesis
MPQSVDAVRLLIISGMPHHWGDGQVVGWGPTAQEIDHLAELFESIRHIAPLHPGPAPASALPYRSKRVEFLPVPAAGGKRWRDKGDILLCYPRYVRAILRELPQADLVHVRCPDNISLLAILLLAVLPAPKLRWVKYAGNWQPEAAEAWSYTLQRWWLKRACHRGLVTVNGSWPDQPAHIKSFLNPCLTDEELKLGRAAAARKRLTGPLRLVYVGRLETPKGVGRALQILSRLRQQDCAATLDLVGDGPERTQFEAAAKSLGLDGLTHFHGWLPRPALEPLYAQSHVMLFPSGSSEGWPKVLSEAMAYGAVPVAGQVSCIPQFLKSFKTGHALPAENIEAFTETILHYHQHPLAWKDHSDNAVEAAALFSYPRYLEAVRTLLGLSEAVCQAA